VWSHAWRRIRKYTPCACSTGLGNDWVDSNSTNGKPTFRRRANLSTFHDLYSCRRNRGLKSDIVDDVQAKVDVFGKKTPYGQIFTNVFRKDSWRRRSTSCVQIAWNLADQKLVKSCIIYLTKKDKISVALPLSLLRGSRPKSVRASSRQYNRSAPNFI